MTIRIASSLPAALRRPALGSLFIALTLSACGGGGGSDAMNPQPEPSPPPPVVSKGSVSLLAGSLGGAGNLDGAGSAARFNNPNGLAVGPTGDLYVADGDNARIRKVTPAGVVSTVAGSGQFVYADGPAMQASFCDPKKIAVGPDGSIFVIDSTRVRKIDAAKNVKTVTGPTTADCDYAAYSNGSVAPKSPSAIAVDAFGIAYILDAYENSVYTLTPAGALNPLAARRDPNSDRASDFHTPHGIALDATRNIYISDIYPNDYYRGIARLTQTGELTVVVPPSAELGEINDLARDATGNLYTVDTEANVVRKITPAGSVSIIAGVEWKPSLFGASDGFVSVDGPLGTGRLTRPLGVAVAADGTVYVTESYFNTIRRIDPATGDLSTLAGLAPKNSFGEYHATDRAGNVFVAVATANNFFEYAIQRIAPDGTATTLVPGGLNAPRGMALDSAGNLYVVDVPYSTINTCVGCRLSATPAVVRKITPRGEMSIFAANLDNARALTIDPAGNLYVAKYIGAPLSKITPQGVVSTIAVTLPGTEQYASGLAADAAGNIYLSSCPILLSASGFTINPADAPPGAAILKVDPRGNVTVLAGSTTEVGYVDGPGAKARFAADRGFARGKGNNACLTGLTLDAAGNVYVADKGNDAVRKITPDGMVSTVVGQKGVRGIVLGPLPASLSEPTDVSLDGAENLLIGSATALLKVQFDR